MRHSGSITMSHANILQYLGESLGNKSQADGGVFLQGPAGCVVRVMNVSQSTISIEQRFNLISKTTLFGIIFL